MTQRARFVIDWMKMVLIFFLKCKLAKQIWRELKLEKEWASLCGLGTARDVIDQIMKAMEDRWQLMFITLWFIWSERNLVREEGHRRPAEIVARAIKIYVGEMGDPPQTQQKTQVQRVVRWAQATGGTFKSELRCFFHPRKEVRWMGLPDQGQ